MTRAEWAARPLVARIEACRCDRDGKLAENEQRQHCGNAMAYGDNDFDQLVDAYALDLPDAPAAAPAECGPMPWRLQIAAMIEAARMTTGTIQDNPAGSLAMADALLAAHRAGGGA